MKEKDLSQRDKPNSKELDITTSYMKFYELCSNGKLKHFTKEQFILKFKKEVKRNEYSNLEEVTEYLYNLFK